MVLYWKESVALIIIEILKDPNLAQYFMKILMQIRRDYFEDKMKFQN